jgi:peptidoglycan hydrolase-like protein with peptidoglycan-binding domain
MKRFVLITTMVAVAGLFAAGQALAAMEESGGMPQSGQGMTMGGHMQEGAMAQNLNQAQVRELQTLLNDKGFKAGKADGILGSKTQQALRQFQQSEGLTQTGQPDEKTLRALAPSADKQQFFGLSPSFGEKNAPMMNKEMEPNKGMEQQPPMQQPMEQQKPMQQPMEQQKPQGGGY